jgi:hypothetical protein
VALKPVFYLLAGPNGASHGLTPLREMKRGQWLVK